MFIPLPSAFNWGCCKHIRASSSFLLMLLNILEVWKTGSIMNRTPVAINVVSTNEFAPPAAVCVLVMPGCATPWVLLNVNCASFDPHRLCSDSISLITNFSSFLLRSRWHLGNKLFLDCPYSSDTRYVQLGWCFLDLVGIILNILYGDAQVLKKSQETCWPP